MMLNSTSSFYPKPKEIDFTVVGLDQFTSQFLNWALEHRDNLEFMKQEDFMCSKSMAVISHFDHLEVIMKIEKPDIRKRT